MKAIKHTPVVRKLNHQIKSHDTVISNNRMIHGASMAQIASDKKDFNNG